MVSVIITTYNYAQYVGRAIRSVLEQSMPRTQYEIIVVNDASTDHTVEVLDAFEQDIRAFHLEKNGGLAAARNFGVQKARGQFLLFLDADDYLHADLLKVATLFLEENSLLDAVSTNYWLVDDRGNHIQHVSAEEKPIACGIMFRKDFFFQIGLYDEAFRAREEEDLRIRWLDKYNIYNIIVPLYRYRMHENNLTKDDEQMSTYKQMLITKHSK